jgi:hypothetical protein
MTFQSKKSLYVFVGLALLLFTLIPSSPANAQQTWTQLSPAGGEIKGGVNVSFKQSVETSNGDLTILACADSHANGM